MPGRIDFTMGFNTHKTAQKPDSRSSYRIYIVGNFSGQTADSWEQRNIRKIDADNVEQTMAHIMPMLEIGSGLRLSFKTLEDFHPDAWFGKVQLLADLQQLKRQLSNPQTAAQAAANIQAYFPSQTQNDTPVQRQEATESQEDMLERLLGKKPEKTSDTPDSVDQLIQHIVSPYVTKDADPRHQALMQVIDVTIGQFLRTLLHGQDFQNLEALWKATAALVNEESADEQSIFLVDISQAELLIELGKDSHAFEQKLLKHVQSGDGEQDILLISDYRFADSAEDRELLKYFSRLANTIGGYFLGGAKPELVENVVSGTSKNVQNWTQYLNEINTDKVILAYPRYLIRLPYGKKRDPIDAFEFEECSNIPQSDELLWGSPVFLCARVLMKTSQGQAIEDAFFFSDIRIYLRTGWSAHFATRRGNSINRKAGECFIVAGHYTVDRFSSATGHPFNDYLNPI